MGAVSNPGTQLNAGDGATLFRDGLMQTLKKHHLYRPTQGSLL
jgi:hypothetical protein